MTQEKANKTELQLIKVNHQDECKKLEVLYSLSVPDYLFIYKSRGYTYELSLESGNQLGVYMVRLKTKEFDLGLIKDANPIKFGTSLRRIIEKLNSSGPVIRLLDLTFSEEVYTKEDVENIRRILNTADRSEAFNGLEPSMLFYAYMTQVVEGKIKEDVYYKRVQDILSHVGENKVQERRRKVFTAVVKREFKKELAAGKMRLTKVGHTLYLRVF